VEYLLYLLPMIAFVVALVLLTRTAGRRRTPSGDGREVHPDHWAEIAALRAEIEQREREAQER
jgi:hypothetical protein